MESPRPLVVVAIGGNALDGGGHRTLDAQWAAARRTGQHIATLAAEGCRLIVTHGNGPQVGDVLRRSELAAPEVSPVTMDVAVAETQGSIGFMLARCLADALAARSAEHPVVAVVTEVVVDTRDPAFRNPTKPVGPYITADEAADRAAHRGWKVRDFGLPGWRRVVASPRPQTVLQMESIASLSHAGAIVIAGGGGGIPVAHRRGRLEGVEAVIDKDLVTSLIARSLEAEVLIIATAVERVTLNYGRPDELPLDRLTVAEARRHLEEGQFPPGSMGPKVEAIVEFVEHTGNRAVVASIATLAKAWRGKAGTVFVP